MKEITSEMIKDLRERTGVGIGKCKEALALAEGDMQKAIDILRKHGMASAVKKEGRETKEGVIVFAEDPHAIALLELNAETDFVVKNERFKAYATEIVKAALDNKPKNMGAFLELKIEKDTIEQKRNLLIQSLGENIQIKRFEIIVKDKSSSYGIYSHMGGKIVSIVEINGTGVDALARDIAMHVAAESPDFLIPADVPLSLVEREKEIAAAQIQGKPANIVEKIVSGKLNSFFDQVCLLRQKYVKENTLSVEQFVAQQGKALNKNLKVSRFWRWKVGQE